MKMKNKEEILSAADAIIKIIDDMSEDEVNAALMENEDYKKSNREQRMEPKRGLFYCSSCDRDMVSNGSRCGTCGHREGVKRLKKE